MFLKIKWWQLIFYEVAVFSLGALIAIKWYEVLSDYIYIFAFLFLVCGVYTIYIFKDQIFFNE